jgi:hypothetical protein
MPTRIGDAKLRALSKQLIEENAQDPKKLAGPQMLDKIIAAIADRRGVSSAKIEAQLKDGNLLPEEKLALAKKGMTEHEASDVKALLSDAAFAATLDPVSKNFLSALVGLEPLKAIDAVDTSVRAGPVGDATRSPEAQAVAKFREVMKNGKLSAYYDAAIGVGDASLKDEAMKLFNALPKLNYSTGPAEFVKLGLWTTAPRGVEAMQKSARFLPGRQVIAPAKINANTGDYNNFLAWDDNGVDAKTYRATLTGEKGDNYLVKIDGKDDPIEVPKAKIHELNLPHDFDGDVLRLSKTVDFNSPFLKAKIAEAAIKMDELVAKLDFTKANTDAGDSRLNAIYGRGSGSQKTSEVQRQCARVIHDVINMKYPSGNVYSEKGRDSGSDAGRLAVRGIGSCYMQASVMAGLLAPFSKSLGIDVQFISGGVYRNTNRSDPPEKQFRSFNSQAHGWLQLTYRPSMELRICDRTWGQPDHSADKAYSKWGDRFPSSLYSSWGSSGFKQQALADTDVKMDGTVSVETFDRQFGEQGVDGRDNHMSTWQ